MIKLLLARKYGIMSKIPKGLACIGVFRSRRSSDD
jgi:hypothetical protein